ncbi:MAG: hypothetical protein P8188_03005 [Gemmatimonadota bacterium]
MSECRRPPRIRPTPSLRALPPAPVLVLALLGGLAACESPTALDATAEPLLRTASTAYTLQPVAPQVHHATIRYSFVNRTGAPVTLRNCNGVFSLGLERRTASGWMRSWSPTVLLCESPPIVIAPGDRWAGSIQVGASPLTPTSFPDLPLDDAEGVYRIIWDHALAGPSASGPLLPAEDRVSNPFSLRLP